MDEWEDTSDVEFDPTVMFGKGWDSFGWELREEIQCKNGRYAVWKEGKKWSAYGGYDGAMNYCGFDSEGDAKAAAERWGSETP